MRTNRGAWALCGLVAGAAGLAVSYAVAAVMAVRDSPVVAVAELVIRLAPGRLVEEAIDRVGSADKPLLVGGILAVLALAFAWAGVLAQRRWWASALVFGALAAVGVAAVAIQEQPSTMSYLPIAAGLVTWLGGRSTTRPRASARARRSTPRPDAAASSSASGRSCWSPAGWGCSAGSGAAAAATSRPAAACCASRA
jgi:hypothetical protein